MSIPKKNPLVPTVDVPAYDGLRHSNGLRKQQSPHEAQANLPSPVLDSKRREVEITPQSDIDGNSCVNQIKVTVKGLSDALPHKSGFKRTATILVDGENKSIRVPEYVNTGDEIFCNRKVNGELVYVSSPKHTPYDLALRTIRDSRAKSNILSTLILAMAHSKLSVCGQDPDSDYKLLEYIMHGGRAMFDLSTLDNNQKADFMGFFTKSRGVYQRWAASHDVSIDACGNPVEKKYFAQNSYKSFSSNHYGADLSIGGNTEYKITREGKKEYFEHPECNGGFGHLYINCKMKNNSTLPKSTALPVRRLFWTLSNMVTGAIKHVRGALPNLKRFLERIPVASYVRVKSSETEFPDAVLMGVEGSAPGNTNKFTKSSHNILGKSSKVSAFISPKIKDHKPGNRARIVPPGEKLNLFVFKVTPQTIKSMQSDLSNPEVTRKAAEGVAFSAHKDSNHIPQADRESRLHCMQQHLGSLSRKLKRISGCFSTLFALPSPFSSQKSKSNRQQPSGPRGNNR